MQISHEPDTAVDVPVLMFACLNVDAAFGDRLGSVGVQQANATAQHQQELASRKSPA